MNRTFYLLLLGHSFATMFAQTNVDIPPGNLRWGLYASGNLNHHEAQFRALPSVPNCCVEFRGNDSYRYSFGALFDYVLEDGLSLEVRLGYSDESSRLYEDNFIGNAILGNDVVEAYSEHSIDATLGLLEFQPLARYRVFNEFPLYAHGGFSIGALLSKSYEQQEAISQPFGATFNNDSTVRNVFRGDIPAALTMQPALIGGISYEVSSSSLLNISTECFFAFPFRSLVDGIDWRVMSLRLGASVRWNSHSPTTPPQSAPIEEKPAPQKFLRLEMQVDAIRPNGMREKNAHLQIDEVQYIEMYPLLPYVFFPENSADLRQTRLHLLEPEATSSFDEHALASNTMAIYSEMLNIIGKRLFHSPSSTIRINGCNNNLNEEMNNARLSTARAEAVKKYLCDIWKIEPSRISIHAQNLPTKFTRNDATDGQVENRRAEILCEDMTIVAPVRIEETKRKPSFTSMEIIPHVVSSSDISRWELRAVQRDSALYVKSGEGIVEKIAWYPEALLNRLISDSLHFHYTAQNADGLREKTEVTLPVTIHRLQTQRFEMRNNVRIERYGLILFDFDLAQLGMMNRHILDSVKSRILPSSNVIIQGYADRTGTHEYNKTLAAMRCEAVYDFLKSSVREDHIRIEAIGSETLLFDNDLPEGRNYNRTVYITIETPE